MDFDTKMTAAGELLEKLAAERGMTLQDFTEEETIDLLGTIMNGDGGGDAGTADVKTASVATVPAPAPVQQPTTKVAYADALAEVMKLAAANGHDLNKTSAEELHKNVEYMQQVMSDPQYQQKQAAFQEKIAEADALGRVMAHAYVDELGKIAAQTTPEPTTDTLAEKKAAFVRELRAKVAGEMPPQFAAHAKGKGDKDKEKGDDKDKEDAEKKASFEKAAALRAAEHLVSEGINPATGAKFASDQERIDAAALILLQQKGYSVG